MASYDEAGNICQALGDGSCGSSGEAQVRVVRNAANGAAMYGPSGPTSGGSGGDQGERWYAVEWLAAAAAVVPPCAWETRTARLAATVGWCTLNLF